MTRTNEKPGYWTYFLSGIFLIFFHSCKTDFESETKPNIILIIADDQGWGDLSINGNRNVQTRNIDKLAERGVQFTRFYVSPVCSPTRAEILTGRYHPRGNIYSTSQGGERLDLDEKTIADLFKSNGYRTAAIGKWHNGAQPPYHPNNRGFDEFYGFCSGHWGNYFSPMLERNGELVKGNGFIIDDFTDEAIKYIGTKSNQPFFLYLAYNTPHSPMQVPDKWWNKYKDVAVDSTHRYSANEKKDKTRAALALCENIDWNVGRIVNRLDSLGKLENTLIIYMSDNGPNGWRWNDGLKGIKGHSDEGGVRSPFILYWKGKLKPKKINTLAGAIDILPSLVDLANVSGSFSKPLDGVSLKPLLFGSDNSWNDRFLFSHWEGKVSVRNQQYMLDQNNQLFDLINDPGQNVPINHPSDSLFDQMVRAKEEWSNTVLKELNRNRKEVFPVGFEGSRYTHLPADDGTPHGNILRSSRWPNSSHFTNWLTVTDSISWDCDIRTSGTYKATVYYTCKETAVGSILSLRQGSNTVDARIVYAHDPSFTGVEFDRFERDESYEKEFRPLEMGVIKLDAGIHSISLKATELKSSPFIDFRWLTLKRIAQE